MTLMEAIEKRTSVRTYSKEELDLQHIDKVKAILEKTQDLSFFGTPPVLQLLNTDPGTFGVIQGSALFLALLVKEKDGSLVYGQSPHKGLIDCGYTAESVVLELTALGLGTCWLGGTFNRRKVEEELALPEDLSLAALIALGEPGDRKTVIEKVFRLGAGSEKRKPFSSLFFLETPETPLPEDRAGSLQPVLQALRIGPSASNKQPWRVILKEEGEKTAALYLEVKEQYEKSAGYPIQSLDAGIALAHIKIASRELGLPLKRIGIPEDSFPGLKPVYSFRI